MFKQYILLSQNPESGAKSDFFMDGKRIEEGADAMIAYDFIKIRISSDDGKHIWKKIELKRRTTNPFLYLYEDNYGNILIQSYFLDKDDLGRRVSYKFCTRRTTSKEIIHKLHMASSIINRHPDLMDINDILSLHKIYLSKNIIIATVLIIVFTVILIWKIAPSH